MDALSVASERFDGPPVVAVSERSCSGRLDHWVQLKGLKKRPDFHGPFDAPSTALFNAHCEQISRRYRLGDSLARGTVTALRPGAGEGGRWIEVDVALPVANESGTERDAVAAADEGGRGGGAAALPPHSDCAGGARGVRGRICGGPQVARVGLGGQAQAEAAGAPPGAIVTHDLRSWPRGVGRLTCRRDSVRHRWRPDRVSPGAGGALAPGLRPSDACGSAGN